MLGRIFETLNPDGYFRSIGPLNYQQTVKSCLKYITLRKSKKKSRK